MKVTRVVMGKRLVEVESPSESAVPVITDKRRLAAFERRQRLIQRAASFVDLTPKSASSLIDQDSTYLRRSLASSAELLLPIAQAHVAAGKWSPHVAAWLLMVRDSIEKKVAPAERCSAPGAVTSAVEGSANDHDSTH